MEVRQSNDKLYEYIFDLEQKIAEYKEELPAMEERVRRELTEYYEGEIERREK